MRKPQKKKLCVHVYRSTRLKQAQKRVKKQNDECFLAKCTKTTNVSLPSTHKFGRGTPIRKVQGWLGGGQFSTAICQATFGVLLRYPSYLAYQIMQLVCCLRIRKIAAGRERGCVPAVFCFVANVFEPCFCTGGGGEEVSFPQFSGWPKFSIDKHLWTVTFYFAGEGLSYLVRELNRHQPIKLGGVERSSLVSVVFVEYGSHLLLSGVPSQRQQGLFQLGLQHQAVSTTAEILLSQRSNERNTSHVSRG